MKESGDFPAARALIASGKIRSDEDAFEVLMCFYTGGDFAALMKFNAQHPWRPGWPLKASRAVAGIVTIEDLLEAIVGNISDEHDEAEADDAPHREPDGAYIVSGTFELSRLRELFADQFPANGKTPEPHDDEDAASESPERDTRDDPTALRLPERYESTTVGGLVSELAGHIPLPGEVVEEEGLRLEVLASTDRRIDSIRVSLTPPDHE